MYDLGQLVTLKTSPVDGDNNPSVPTGLALSVQQPDGTQLAPAVTQVGQTFIAKPVPTQAGRHVARWLSSDGWADTSTFDVWPADPRFLFNLAEARGALRSGTAPTSRDDTIRLYIAAVTPVIEDIVGPVVPETRTFTFDGGTQALVLPGAAQAGSVSATVDGVTAAVTVNPGAGIVYAGTGIGGGCFSPGRQNVVVTAKVGMAIVPPNVKLAALEEFRFLWQIGQEASHSAFAGDDTEVEYTPSGFAVPRRVIELCGPHQRIGAIG